MVKQKSPGNPVFSSDDDITSGKVVIYETGKGKSQLIVQLQNDTVWLTLNQLAELFDRDKSVISRHISAVYSQGELSKDATVAKNATVQSEGGRRVKREVEYYNLDVIISVGYRVNSVRGTQFRIWAGKILKEYLVEGYAINEKRLKEKIASLEKLKKAVSLINAVSIEKQLSSNETEGLLKVITSYSRALDLLERYDNQTLEKPAKSEKDVIKISYQEARKAIDILKLKNPDSTFMGNEKDNSLNSSLNAIFQTFDGVDLYPSVEEKAANLLYFLVKNHSFSDGNKRIAAYLFILFLDKNGLLYLKNGAMLIDENTLVAVTLMIAQSDPAEKDMIINVLINLMHNE